MTSLVVFTWSRSFETLWPDLATASGVALDLCVAEPGALPEWSSREDAVLLCAAGGMETDASAALERMTIGARLAIVGILGSSVALQASVARALPDVPRCHADHRLTAPRSPSAHAPTPTTPRTIATRIARRHRPHSSSPRARARDILRG